MQVSFGTRDQKILLNTPEKKQIGMRRIQQPKEELTVAEIRCTINSTFE
jgi:hypothetical protein